MGYQDNLTVGSEERAATTEPPAPEERSNNVPATEQAASVAQVEATDRRLANLEEHSVVLSGRVDALEEQLTMSNAKLDALALELAAALAEPRGDEPTAETPTAVPGTPETPAG